MQHAQHAPASVQAELQRSANWAVDGTELYARLTAADAPPALRLPLRSALDAIDAALRLYGPDRLLLSFNGGKDATVLLHLARAAYAHAGAGAPRCVYWDDPHCFPEVLAFVEAAALQYRLPLTRYSCGFTDGLRDAVDRLGTAAVLLGTRTCDPNGRGADAFQPSSRGWPPFMRVNPLLRWSYHDIWRCLRGFGLPFCALYERGYTSLGNATDTQPNPALLRDDGAYAPPEQLASASLERGGRAGCPSSSAAAMPHTVGLLVADAGVLAGAADDAASHVAQCLREHGGALLTRVEAVSEGAADIADSLRRLVARCDFVLVKGAHCAALLAGVAAAFELQLVPWPHLSGALLPEGAEVAQPCNEPCSVVTLRVGSSTVLLPDAAGATVRAACALVGMAAATSV